jgi:hypothetical protein
MTRGAWLSDIVFDKRAQAVIEFGGSDVSEEKFIGYIQEPDVHDGVIVSTTYKSGFLRSIFDRRVVLVLVLTIEERLFAIRFSRVRSASIKNVDGMRLYALSE